MQLKELEASLAEQEQSLQKAEVLINSSPVSLILCTLYQAQIREQSREMSVDGARSEQKQKLLDELKTQEQQMRANTDQLQAELQVSVSRGAWVCCSARLRCV